MPRNTMRVPRKSERFARFQSKRIARCIERALTCYAQTTKPRGPVSERRIEMAAAASVFRNASAWLALRHASLVKDDE
ncbi:hypothetical protein [Burkholderia sp. LMG 32019]|uniref:hypothetical protein n=1 Tax=Burkholderia sp. LMG 32019 TaxID=3158173 RepID=UPI003C2D42C1